MVLHVLQVIFALLGLGTAAAWFQYRRPILLGGVAAYLTSTLVSYRTSAWWPLLVGFAIAYVLHRRAGDFHPLSPSSYRDLPTLLAALDKEAAASSQDDQRAVAAATKNSRVVAVLTSRGHALDDLDTILRELDDSGLGEHARQVIQHPDLLESYFSLLEEPLPAGWTDADRRLRIATIFREHLRV